MHEATAIVMALQLPFDPLDPPANKCYQVLFDSLAHTAEEKRAPHYLLYHLLVLNSNELDRSEFEI